MLNNKKGNWTRDELLVALNLYCKIPFSKISHKSKVIEDAALVLGRSPSAVALKLSNFASLDPVLKQRNISGMSHVAKADIEIWEEFNNNWEKLAFESEQVLAKLKNETLEQVSKIYDDDLPKEGKERESLIKVRVNQAFFRKMVLASYNMRCCITGISIPGVLVASHIVPWAIDTKNRMNPSNGFCLNALHDKAFDLGLITITQDYTVKLSEKLKSAQSETGHFFMPYDNKKIELPQRFYPSPEFLEYHNQHIFIQ